MPNEPRTGDTRRNPRDDRKEKLRTEYLKVQFRHFLIELFRQQEDIDLVSLSFLPISQKIKLRQFETVLLRRTPTQTASRHSASPTQDCSKLGTTMGWKWFSRICERQQQVGPDQNVHNLPSVSPGTLETSPTELRDHTSRYTTTGPLPCKVHVELRRLTDREYHRRPSIALNARTCGCRDNLQQPVAPRRQGSRGPSPSRTGVFGSPPLGAIPTLVREYLVPVTSGS